MEGHQGFAQAMSSMETRTHIRAFGGLLFLHCLHITMAIPFMPQDRARLLDEVIPTLTLNVAFIGLGLLFWLKLRKGTFLVASICFSTLCFIGACLGLIFVLVHWGHAYSPFLLSFYALYACWSIVTIALLGPLLDMSKPSRPWDN